jgi:putative Ca2+/H+ antiporter (TMEM165/GDT1 family)
MAWLAAATSAFAVILPVELPDKTFVATLVLSTKFRPLPVWLGVTAAFGVQCVVAVAAGRVISLLPALPVRLAAALLFAAGAIVLLRSARTADTDEAAEEQRYRERIDAKSPESASLLDSAGGAATTGAPQGKVNTSQEHTWRRAFATSFLVIFAAEWGDLSQLLTAGLVASGRPSVPVFAGSWAALSLIAGLGVLLGRVILRYVKLQLVRYVGAGVCGALAAVIAVAAFA